MPAYLDARDRRKTQPIQWALVLAVLLNSVLGVYAAGKLYQQVQDLGDRIGRLEQQLDHLNGRR